MFIKIVTAATDESAKRYIKFRSLRSSHSHLPIKISKQVKETNDNNPICNKLPANYR